jgi:GntP family gluconate:H+ symporter
MQIVETEQVNSAPAENQAVPSGGLSLFVLLFPILLILVGSLMAEFLPKENSFRSVMAFVGDKNVAMLIGVAVAAIALKPYCRKTFDELVSEGGANAGLLVLIVGAGGSFGAIINGSGIAGSLVNVLSSLNLSYLWLGFLLTAILRAAQGSATVAAVTASSILGPMLVSSGDNPVMVGLAICCGSMCFSFPNDSGFWVISRFSGLTVPQMLRAWTLTSTVSGFLGFACTLLLDWIL